MRLAVLVNDSSGLLPRMTTTMLVAAATARDHEVWVLDVASLTWSEPGAITARGRVLRRATTTPEVQDALVHASPTLCRLEEADAILVRTSPGRDQERARFHETAIGLLDHLETRGVPVHNCPRALRWVASKLHLTSLPAAARPRSLVAAEVEPIFAFLESLGGPAVLKPLHGTRGTDVFRVEGPTSPNVLQIIEVLTREGPCIVQAMVEPAGEGDTRLLMLQGEILRVGGHPAAVRRIPPQGDFRSNVHRGGSAAPGELTEAILETARLVGPILRAQGVFLAGLDLMQGKVIEVNAFSPGGLFDAERYFSADFSGAIIEAIESAAVA